MKRQGSSNGQSYDKVVGFFGEVIVVVVAAAMVSDAQCLCCSDRAEVGALTE